MKRGCIRRELQSVRLYLAFMKMRIITKVLSERLCTVLATLLSFDPQLLNHPRLLLSEAKLLCTILSNSEVIFQKCSVK